MLVIVRCSVVSAHCAVVTLAVSARGSQVFASCRDVYHAPLSFGRRSAHYIATAGKIYEHPLAVGEKCRLHRFSCPPSPLWVPAGPRYDPRGNQRVADLTHEHVTAPRLTFPSFVVSVDHKDPTGCRGG